MSAQNEKRDVSTLGEKLGFAFFEAKHLPKMWSLVWSASKGWSTAWLALLVVQGLIPVAAVYLTRQVVDKVVAAVASHGSKEALFDAFLPAALMGCALLVSELIKALLGFVREYQAELIQDKIADRLHSTSTSVDLSFYETPEYFDSLHRARNEAWFRPLRLVDNAGALIQSAITLAAMAAVLLSFGLWVPLVLVASTVPALYAVARHAIKQHRFRLKFTSDERRAWYYDFEMTSTDTAAELRLFGLSRFFSDLYKSTRSRLRSERFHLLRQQSAAEAGAAAAALLTAAVCIGWMGYKALNGLLTLGDLALFFAAFRQGQLMMGSLLSNVGEIYRNVLFLSDLFEFLSLSPAIEDPQKPINFPLKIEKGISFRNVAFAYPGSKQSVLEGFNLNIPAGKIAAIVGPNGSGKSTLVKLITRLYDPASGSVEIDGEDLRSFRVSDVRNAVAALFQKPVQYSFTAAKNIELGDVYSNVLQSDLECASKKAGLDDVKRKLKDGLDTLLGKWFEGGTELSHGEWQRVALARALLKQTPILILDEPTSAMDSWAEAEWMSHLKESLCGRTVLIITHRFTTAMRADIIHVIKDRCIIESGTHDALVALDGYYAESWKNQLKNAPPTS